MRKLHNLRIQRGYTQKQLADLMQVDRSMIAKWENGINKPRADRLIQLAKIFHCSVDELLKS